MRIVEQIFKEAEKLALQGNECAIYDVHELNLKVAVHFSERCIECNSYGIKSDIVSRNDRLTGHD